MLTETARKNNIYVVVIVCYCRHVNVLSNLHLQCSSVHDPNSQKWDVNKKNGSNGRPGMINFEAKKNGPDMS